MALADNMPNDRPGDMVRRIADLERAIRELRAARTLDQATITALAGLGIRTSDFDGTDFAHPGTGGNYFGGDGIVLNQAYFRPGSVSNDALTNPVKPAIVRLSQAPFSLSTSYATLDSASVTVPDGFTKLFVPNATARLYVVNTNTTGGGDGAGLEAIYVKVSVGANESTATPTGVSGFNGFATTFANDAFLLEDLTSGSSVSFTLQGKCAYSGVPSYADNYAIASFGLSWSR